MRHLRHRLDSLRHQDGYAVVAAVMIMFIVLGLGIALLYFTDIQQKAGAREQSKENSYTLAEAALNAQISELAAIWSTAAQWTPASSAPSSCTPSGGVYPSGCQCNPSSTFSGCPNPSGAWITNYGSLGSAYCPPGTPTDAWGAAPTTTWSTVNNSWATYVRDDGGGTGSVFSSTGDVVQPPYDLNGNGSVWVRAVGILNCQETVLINKVSEELVALPFPRYAVTANSFTISNNGNKIMIDTWGADAQTPSGKNPNNQAGGISTRCANLGAANCTTYRQGAQVSVDTCVAASTAPYGCTEFPSTSSQTITNLEGLKAEAMAAGTYFANLPPFYSCPTSASQLASVTSLGGIAPVYVDTSCPNLSFTGTATINSSAQPGFLVLTTQSLSLGGGTTFYGLIYDANLCGSSGAWSPCTTPATMVSTSGTALIQGSIDVDGAGSVNFGDSNLNLVYDSRIFPQLQSFGGAVSVQNSFRVLNNNQ